MLDKIRKFWSLPVFAVYLYAIAILAYSGYNQYYHIPTSYIEFSLVFNVTFFRMIAEVIWSTFTVLVVLLFITWLIARSYAKTIVDVVTVALALILLYNMPSFGQTLAKNNTEFYMFKDGCNIIPHKEGIKYISPLINDGEAIFISIDASSTLQSGFQVINLSDKVCELEKKTMNKVIVN